MSAKTRTALQVDFNKPAWEQTNLHVCNCRAQAPDGNNYSITDTNRTAGIQKVHCTNTPTNHPLTPSAVPACGKIKNGEIVRIECIDWMGGQIKNNDSADDVKNVDLTQVHYVSGPFEIETAEPGDVLFVEIQDVQPFWDRPWGFSGVFHKQNGGGFLTQFYPEAYVSSHLVADWWFTRC